MNYQKKILMVLVSIFSLFAFSCNLISSDSVEIADVVFSPASGSVEKDQTVTLTCASAGVEIWCAVNEAIDSDSFSFKGQKVSSFKVTEDCTVYAIATDGKGHFSKVAKGEYSIKAQDSGNSGNSGESGESGGGSEEAQIITESIIHNAEGLKVYGTDGKTELEPSASTKADAGIGKIPGENIVITAGGSGIKAKYWTDGFRFYAKNTLVFTPVEGKNLTKIEFGDVDSSCTGDITVVGNGEYSSDSYIWEGVATSNEPVTLSMGAAFRFKSIILTFGPVNSGSGSSGESGQTGGESGESGNTDDLGEETVIVITGPSSDVEISHYTTSSGKDAVKVDSATKDGTTVLFNYVKGTKSVYDKEQFRVYAGTEVEFVNPSDKTLVKVEFSFAEQNNKGTVTLKSGPIAPNRGEYDSDYFVWTGMATPSAHLVFYPEQAAWITEIKLTYKEGIGTPSELIPPFEPAKLSDFLSGKAKSYTVTYTGNPFTTKINSADVITSGKNDNDELLLGNPTGAKNDVSCTTNYLLKEEIGNYTISYNNQTHNPNWVAWHLAKADLGDGSVKRQDDFRANEKLPEGYYRVTNNDYGGSGFDQGHMLNSYDRLSSVAINSSTFYMTNMVPQSGTCNRGTWKGLEDFEQKTAEAGSELYIICGPYGQGGDTQKNGVAKLFETNTIVSKSDSSIEIIVPRYVWKILIVLDEGSGDIDRINANTTVIAAIIPNSTCVKGSPWTDYVCSVDYIEELTGYDFFANLPDEVEDALESKIYK